MEEKTLQGMGLASQPKLSKEEQIKAEAITQAIFTDSVVGKFCNVLATDHGMGIISYLDYVNVGNKNDGQIGIKPMTVNAQLESHVASISMAHEQIENLKNDFNIEIIPTVENLLIAESKQEVQKIALNKIYDCGLKKYNDSFTRIERFKKWFLKLFRKSYIKAYDCNNNIRKLITKILAHSNKIAVNGRRGPGNRVIVSLGLATLLQDDSSFAFDNIPINSPNNTLYKIGSIANIEIYVDANKKWNDYSVTVLRAPSESEPGFYVPYHKHSYAIQTISESTMAPKVFLKTRFAVVPVGSVEDTIETFYVKNLKL